MIESGEHYTNNSIDLTWGELMSVVMENGYLDVNRELHRCRYLNALHVDETYKGKLRSSSFLGPMSAIPIYRDGNFVFSGGEIRFKYQRPRLELVIIPRSSVPISTGTAESCKRSCHSRYWVLLDVKRLIYHDYLLMNLKPNH